MCIRDSTKTLARNIEVEDTANVLVEYENGAIGTIQGTTSVNPGYPRVIEISGTNGTVVLKEDVIIRWDVEGSDFPVEKALSLIHIFPETVLKKGTKNESTYELAE